MCFPGNAACHTDLLRVILILICCVPSSSVARYPDDRSPLLTLIDLSPRSEEFNHMESTRTPSRPRGTGKATIMFSRASMRVQRGNTRPEGYAPIPEPANDEPRPAVTEAMVRRARVPSFGEMPHAMSEHSLNVAPPPKSKCATPIRATLCLC